MSRKKNLSWFYYVPQYLFKQEKKLPKIQLWSRVKPGSVCDICTTGISAVENWNSLRDYTKYSNQLFIDFFLNICRSGSYETKLIKKKIVKLCNHQIFVLWICMRKTLYISAFPDEWLNKNQMHVIKTIFFL